MKINIRTISPAVICCFLWCGMLPSGFSVCMAQDTSTPERSELPQLEDMQRPPLLQELLDASDQGNEFDWVILKDGSVIVCQPVYPRPDTLTKMAEELKELENTRPSNAEERQQLADRRKRLGYVVLNLPGDFEDYQIPKTQVEDVVSFEQLMLERVDVLLEEQQIQQAYELLKRVERSVPGWEPTTSRFENLLLTESAVQRQSGNHYAAMALLDELAARNLTNQQLPVAYGELIDPLIGEATENRDFARAQFLIGRLSRHFPDHPVVLKWRNQYESAASMLLAEAGQLSLEGRHAEAAERARRAESTWPATGNDRAASVRLRQRFQVVRVGVSRFADPDCVFPAETPADRRHAELTIVPLFEAANSSELTWFQSGCFEKWDPADLGREVVFFHRKSRPYWQSQPVLTAHQVADELALRLRPDGPEFDSRLSSFVSAFAVRSDNELLVRFDRVPLSIEALFRFPVTAPAAEGGGREVVSTRFQLEGETGGLRRYSRRIPEPDGLSGPQYHVAEVVESEFPERHAAIQAFLRNEIDVLPHLRPWEVDAFQASGVAFVNKYSLPLNHVITFNPASEAVRNVQLRRALSIAVNRDNLLKNVVLRDPRARHGRVTGVPWSSSSYATNPSVMPPAYDIRLAFALKFSAEEQLKIPVKREFIAAEKQRILDAGGEFDELEFRRDNQERIKEAAAHIRLPPIRLVVEPDEVALEAAEKIAGVWRRLQLDVEVIPGDTKGAVLGDGDWDLMYRVVRLEEPLLDLWPLMTNDPSVQIDRLESYPDWMRQELINLDYAASFQDARDRLFTIQRHIAAQAFLIPLWEVDDYIALQRNLSGFDEKPMTPYDSVERWVVKP